MTNLPTPTDSTLDSKRIENLLLQARSDKYGDSGNYNDVKLKAAIQREVTQARLDEALFIEKLYNSEMSLGAALPIRITELKQRLKEEV